MLCAGVAVSARRPEDVRAWLQTRPSLRELREAYPREWDTVQHDLGQAVGGGDVEALKAYVLALASRAPAPARGGRSRAAQEAQLAAQIRRQMTVAALREASLSAATGVTSGRVRFNLVNGWVMQRLLFRRGFERKPVSRFWFRLLWPLLWQRRYLMPLVEPKGIYCFYSRDLVRALAARIGNRSCVEIAAGDGTLSRFLADEGVQVTATDDHSWTHAIDFPSTVVRQDARTALRARRPAVVLCSWPPPGNTFEAEVFRTPSVELYLLIASRHEFAAGNFVAYEEQSDFTVAEDPELSRLVLPPELEAAVYVFERSPE
jgi:hypothetical protein